MSIPGIFLRVVLLITALLSTTNLPAFAQAPEFPFDVQLVKPLGFRLQPGLNAAPVLTNRNYLQPPTRVTVLSATGPLWQAGTFCHVQYSGKQGFIRCDAQDLMTVMDTSSGGPVVAGQQCTPSMESGPFYTPKEPPAPGRAAFGVQFCNGDDDKRDCVDFCAKHCTLCTNKWKETASGNDGATSCPTAPTTGEGLLPADATDPIHSLDFVEVPANERAGADAAAGLTRLSEHIARSPAWRSTGYTVRVVNCYRPPLEEIEKICNLILKGTHVLNKYPDDPGKKAEFTGHLNPKQNKGLTWPGANPHSAGQACDLVVLDRNGRPWFDSAAGPGTERNSPEQRAALQMLDEVVTASGGRRLKYEAWHYEWGNSTAGSRCTHPQCDREHWPPCGNPSCQ